MNDYDCYLRHAAVREGEWVGFALAWKGLAGAQVFGQKPYTRWRPWLPDPDQPDDPTQGTAGVWQWRLEIALLDGLMGLLGLPVEDGRTSVEMRSDLLAFLELPVLQFKDVDGTISSALVTAYQEWAIEPYDAAHAGGGWLARLELALVAA